MSGHYDDSIAGLSVSVAKITFAIDLLDTWHSLRVGSSNSGSFWKLWLTYYPFDIAAWGAEMMTYGTLFTVVDPCNRHDISAVFNIQPQSTSFGQQKMNSNREGLRDINRALRWSERHRCNCMQLKTTLKISQFGNKLIDIQFARVSNHKLFFRETHYDKPPYNFWLTYKRWYYWTIQLKFITIGKKWRWHL